MAAPVTLRLRVLTADDWELWRAVRLAALAEAPYAFGSRLADWQGAGDREERWRARLSLPGALDLLAVLDGEPVGQASGVPDEEGRVVRLLSVWAGPRARGLGVGDALVGEVERWARHAGARTLELAVSPGNGHARALYRRHGFVDTGRLGEEVPGGGREQVWVKELSAPPAR
ncbi:GNAT family N-acetyltransferase [Streptomyces sp. TRM 70351]|uniref:GNAT family N-acetyltransferase n=1 Tax=Streptomyces sp. TRM 70351 TaxID=3116552 RepID=UPI002E7B9F9B|nr:GNAT family N-acetyltransferase [Streptomyces sp. TRM 70351]MEE1929483.1 GNAT family N-acetyltransferase [Streptomyces sp. TRM 70351]